MARCLVCNAENPGSARFCVACGASLAAKEAGVGAATSTPPAPGPRTTVPGQPLLGALLPEDPAHRASLAAGSANGPAADVRAPHVLPAPLAGSLPRRAPGGHLPAGTLVDQKYVVERVLGEGGMGVVYLARDVHTGLHVVLKAVRQELGHRPDVRARTLAEGRALAQIDHPNVVHLKAVVAERDDLWLVMQYIDGESLEQTLARHAEERRRMPLPEALSIFRQIASGIAAAHREGDPPRPQAGERAHPRQGRRREGHGLRHRQGRGGRARGARADQGDHRLALLHVAGAGPRAPRARQAGGHLRAGRRALRDAGRAGAVRRRERHRDHAAARGGAAPPGQRRASRCSSGARRLPPEGVRQGAGGSLCQLRGAARRARRDRPPCAGRDRCAARRVEPPAAARGHDGRRGPRRAAVAVGRCAGQRACGVAARAARGSRSAPGRS